MMKEKENVKEILFEILMCISSCHSERIIVNNNIYRPHVALVSSVFPDAIDYFILKNFPGRVVHFS